MPAQVDIVLFIELARIFVNERISHFWSFIFTHNTMVNNLVFHNFASAAAAAAKSFQLYPTLYNPIDGSQRGSSVPGILQARILEWVAISFSNACMHAKLLQSCPTLCDPMDSSPPGSSIHGILQARILEWAAISFSNFITLHMCKYNYRRDSLNQIQIAWKDIYMCSFQWIAQLPSIVCVSIYISTASI